jgi:hypothetical protein
MPTSTVPATNTTRLITTPSRAQLLRHARELTSTATNHLPFCHILHAISTPRVVQPGWSSGRLVPDPDVRDPDQPASRQLRPYPIMDADSEIWLDTLARSAAVLRLWRSAAQGEACSVLCFTWGERPSFWTQGKLAYFDDLIASFRCGAVSYSAVGKPRFPGLPNQSVSSCNIIGTQA